MNTPIREYFPSIKTHTQYVLVLYYIYVHTNTYTYVSVSLSGLQIFVSG